VLKALYLVNVARLEFVAWRHHDSPIAPDDLQKLFEDGIYLSPKDPFAHCWYGTFLKDVKKDFREAENAYRLAIQLSENTADPFFRDHPLFLNNLALLIMDEVELGRRRPEDLREAKKLLAKAVARVPETKADFFWPEHSADWCETLIKEFRVV
jgi:tetratricopeptide (TPR) repeat protein